MSTSDIVHELRTHARGQQTGSIDRTKALMMRAADVIESLRNELAAADAAEAARDTESHDCESCGKSVVQCNQKIRITGTGCCGVCFRTDTHGLLVKN